MNIQSRTTFLCKSVSKEKQVLEFSIYKEHKERIMREFFIKTSLVAIVIS